MFPDYRESNGLTRIGDVNYLTEIIWVSQHSKHIKDGISLESEDEGMTGRGIYEEG